MDSMQKNKSYLSDEDILKLKEVLSNPLFWAELEQTWKAEGIEIDKMREIDIKILREPMTI